MSTRSIIFTCITAWLLYSCSTDKLPVQTGENGTADFKKLDTSISFAGYWLSEDYYEGIMEHHSPKKAQDESQFIIIPGRTLQQLIIIYNFHEGGAFLKILKHGPNYEVWEVQDDSLTQMLYPVELISSTKIKLKGKTFVKIDLQHERKILEALLFKGQYSNAAGKTIEFKANGQVLGLDPFSYYEPVIDYYDAGMQVDQVGLGHSEKDLEWYGFKFNTDTLELYKLKCLEFDSAGNNCVEVEFGALAQKMWRKK